MDRVCRDRAERGEVGASAQLMKLQNGAELSLLLDTACSGIVLWPETVKQYNLPCQSTPVTMTGAGGVSGSTDVTTLRDFVIQGCESSRKFGPLPAAVQDIGLLPRGLDGIIGLSFLNQFYQVEMDFRTGVIGFAEGESDAATSLLKGCSVAAEASMRLLPGLSIYAFDVMLGGRGPVCMLVDTGASNTILNWNGVSQLGLSRDAQFLTPIQTPFGAMGSDNQAIPLTHRLHVSSQLSLGSTSGATGISLDGTGRLAIDIGDIPILDSLQSQGIGGILGMDAMMRCSGIRINLKGRERKLCFVQQ